jgi:hypothetical protein
MYPLLRLYHFAVFIFIQLRLKYRLFNSKKATNEHESSHNFELAVYLRHFHTLSLVDETRYGHLPINYLF